jgi:hypothetical protein
MKIPSELKIGGHKVTVEIVKDLEECGNWDVKASKIQISGTLPKDQQEATLIHEILHAMNVTFVSNNTAHAFMESLSEQLYQVLSDNKMLR